MCILLRKIVIGLCVFCSSMCVTNGETKREVANEILPDKVIQDKIDELVRQSQTTDRLDRCNVAEAAKELSKSFPDQLGQIIVQLLVYEHNVDNERFMHAADFILLELADNLKKRKTMVDIAPFLSLENRTFKNRLYELMDYYCCNGGPKTDYGRILDMMKDNNGKLPDGLVQYMFERSPGNAFVGHARFFCTRSGFVLFLLAEHEISETLWKHQNHLMNSLVVEPGALQQLNKLSRHDVWWARLYAAQIVRQHRGFRQPEIIERLKKDKHPLVREAMSFADKDSK